MTDFNEQIMQEFRANHGRLGGSFAGAPVLLLHTTGARTGRDRVSPLMYLDLDGHRYVFASKAGADSDPDWYRNLLAHPDVSVEGGSETYPATARPLPPGDRDRVFAEQARRFANFAEYQAKTTRTIPVVELVRKS